MLHKKTSFKNLPILNFAQQILNLAGLVLFAISIMIPIHVFALPQELVKNYGGSPSIDNRVVSGLLVLYTFDEGNGKTIYDISGVGNPLNLTVADETAINWLANGGVVINSPTVISSSNAATKIIDACQDTNEITIEAWITPINNSQDGPARIVTLSDDPYNRNFTLAQGRWDTQPSEVYDARLRTTTTSNNGRPSITSQVGSLTVELTHVVYTRDSSGTAKIYINVLEEGSGMASGDFSNWNGNYAMALGNELTGDRPWLGEIHLIAIYNRSLSLEEIEQNFVAGQDIGECHSNENCGFCEKCEDGICVSQTDSEDLKDECTEGECKTGYCDGASACGLIFEGTPCNDDGNVCTDDECDGAGECVHLNNNSFS